MKLTWKKKDSKKRPLAAVWRNPDLPFGEEEEEEEENNSDHCQDQDSNKTHGESSNKKTAANKRSGGSSDDKQKQVDEVASSLSKSHRRLAESFQEQGNKLAEEGKFREALGKWEAALNLMPGSAVLHEQKAQVLLEIGDAWSALKAAKGATELKPSWSEAWITLGRAQLNFGEPDSAIESFDRALAIQPDSKEAQDDRHTALELVKRRKLLHASGLSINKSRYVVGQRTGSS